MEVKDVKKLIIEIETVATLAKIENDADELSDQCAHIIGYLEQIRALLGKNLRRANGDINDTRQLAELFMRAWLAEQAPHLSGQYLDKGKISVGVAGLAAQHCIKTLELAVGKPNIIAVNGKYITLEVRRMCSVLAIVCSKVLNKSLPDNVTPFKGTHKIPKLHLVKK